MKIKLHSSAKQDLIDGYHFYEYQEQTIGQYFLDSLYSDIDSLIITAGIHLISHNEFYRMLSKRFPFAFITKFQITSFMLKPSLIVEKNPLGYEND